MGPGQQAGGSAGGSLCRWRWWAWLLLGCLCVLARSDPPKVRYTAPAFVAK